MADLARANEIIASEAGPMNRNAFALPWYVSPKYHAAGATVLNVRGEQVAEFEDIREAELCAARVNGAQS